MAVCPQQKTLPILPGKREEYISFKVPVGPHFKE